jgi:hypothetical protein
MYNITLNQGVWLQQLCPTHPQRACQPYTSPGRAIESDNHTSLRIYQYTHNKDRCVLAHYDEWGISENPPHSNIHMVYLYRVILRHCLKINNNSLLTSHMPITEKIYEGCELQNKERIIPCQWPQTPLPSMNPCKMVLSLPYLFSLAADRKDKACSEFWLNVRYIVQ